MIFNHYLAAWLFARKLGWKNFRIEKLAFNTWHLKEIPDEIAFPPITGA